MENNFERKQVSPEEIEEWLDDFKNSLLETEEKLGKKENLESLPASARELVLNRIETLKSDIDNLSRDISENDWEEVKKILSERLNNILN